MTSPEDYRRTTDERPLAVTHRGTVGGLLERAWRRRTQGVRPAWATHLAPSDVQQWIMRAVASHPFADAAAVPIGPTDRELGRTAAVDLARQLEDPGFWAAVVTLGGLADALAVDITRRLDATPNGDRPHVTASRVSEKACAIVARHYRDRPVSPEWDTLAAEGAVFVALEIERAARLRRFLSEAEFVKHHTAAYDELWARRGAATLAVLRPSELGVGWRERPPMTGDDNGWRAGTDQAVCARYRYHLRISWARCPAADGQDRDQYIDRRLARMQPDDLCRHVVDRACSPIGLRSRRHHALVASFVAGVRRADLQAAHDPGGKAPQPGALREWAEQGHALPDTADEAFEAAVTDEAERWARRHSIAQALAEGIPATWTAQVELGTTRRLWDAAHSREAQWEVPFVRSEVTALVPAMFRAHLRELIHDPVPEPADEDGPLLPDDPLLQRTLDAFARTPESARALFALARQDYPRWVPMYEELTASLGERRLPPPVFRRWVLGNGSEG